MGDWWRISLLSTAISISPRLYRYVCRLQCISAAEEERLQRRYHDMPMFRHLFRRKSSA